MFDIKRKPIEKEFTENRYESIGFEQNPFPINPSVKFNSEDTRENGSIFYEELREKEIRSFKDLVNTSNSINLLMDYAAYRGRGNGKTAFLNYQRRVVNEDLGFKITDGKKVLFLVYVAPSGEKKERKFWQISKLFFEAMLEQDLMLIAFCRLRALTGLIPESILREVDINNLSKTLGDDKWLQQKLLLDIENPDILEINKAISTSLLAKGSKIDLRRKNLFDNTYDYFKKLICDDLSDYYWRAHGNSLVFDELVKIFITAEISNCYFLFDEAEKIITAQNSNERREFADSLRYNFIDGNVENCANSFFRIIMTIHPYSQELLLPHWKSAGLERFAEIGTGQASDNTLFFHPIDKEELALPLAEAYINNSRIENWHGSIFFPFEESALKYAFLKSDKIPGKYLRLLYKLVEKTINEHWSQVTTKEIDRVIETDKFLNIDDNQENNEKLPEPKNRLDK